MSLYFNFLGTCDDCPPLGATCFLNSECCAGKSCQSKFCIFKI